MQIARVIGTVVGTQKDPSLSGSKFLLLQFIDESGEALPEYEVALDYVGAGYDEWVLVTRGSAARQVSESQTRPSDAAVVAIIDTITAGKRSIYSKKDHDR